MEWQDLETFSFGDGPDLANRLLGPVLSGTKRATCWAESQGLLSAEVGKLMVVLDGQGVPKAVLKTIELTKRRFDEQIMHTALLVAQQMADHDPPYEPYPGYALIPWDCVTNLTTPSDPRIHAVGSDQLATSTRNPFMATFN